MLKAQRCSTYVKWGIPILLAGIVAGPAEGATTGPGSAPEFRASLYTVNPVDRPIDQLARRALQAIADTDTSLQRDRATRAAAEQVFVRDVLSLQNTPTINWEIAIPLFRNDGREGLRQAHLSEIRRHEAALELSVREVHQRYSQSLTILAAARARLESVNRAAATLSNDQHEARVRRVAFIEDQAATSINVNNDVIGRQTKEQAHSRLLILIKTLEIAELEKEMRLTAKEIAKASAASAPPPMSPAPVNGVSQNQKTPASTTPSPVTQSATPTPTPTATLTPTTTPTAPAQLPALAQSAKSNQRTRVLAGTARLRSIKLNRRKRSYTGVVEGRQIFRIEVFAGRTRVARRVLQPFEKAGVVRLAIPTRVVKKHKRLVLRVTFAPRAATKSKQMVIKL